MPKGLALCQELYAHLRAGISVRGPTYNGVDLVYEEDGGSGEAGALEGVAQQGLALAHVHGEQLRPRQRLQAHPAAARRRLRHPRLAAPCAAKFLMLSQCVLLAPKCRTALVWGWSELID